MHIFRTIMEHRSQRLLLAVIVLSAAAVGVATPAAAQFTQQGKLVGTNFVCGGSPCYGEGTSVSLSSDGNTAIVGGPGDDGAGAAWVFTRSGEVWSQQAEASRDRSRWQRRPGPLRVALRRRQYRHRRRVCR